MESKIAIYLTLEEARELNKEFGTVLAVTVQNELPLIKELHKHLLEWRL